MFRIIKSTDLTSSSKLSLREDMEGKWTLYSFNTTNFLYNITEKNNIIPIRIGVGEVEMLVIPSGFYSYIDLEQELLTQLSTLETFTVSYSLITGKFTFTSPMEFRFEFDSYPENSAKYLLGIHADTLSALTHTSTTPADLISAPVFFIEIREDRDRRFKDSDHLDASFMISSDSLFQEAIRVDDINNPTQNICLNRGKNLTITFLALDGSLIDMTDRTWFLVLKKID